MPRYSAWAVRLSLLYLALGFTFGALLLANKGIPFLPFLWTLVPAHIEILIFGWIIQLAFGVAFWILPRYSGGGRGNENLFVASVLSLNFGIWLVAVGSYGMPFLGFLGRLMEITAGFFFLLHAWRRIKPWGV
jgi:hypothetical protein